MSALPKAWLEECWYQFGWGEEVCCGKPLVRKILDLPILMWRDEDDALSAVLDMCPHRFAPLSAGQVAGGVITCGYHGLAFKGDGSCAANPYGPVTSAIRVRSFKVMERHGAIWVWMGKGAPDPDALPDLSFIDETPEAARIQGYIPTDADYRLVIDNIMDLSHADYLHPTTLGGMMVQSRASSATQDDRVVASWEARDCDPPAAFRSSIPDGEKADVTISVEWLPPSLIKLSVCAVPTGVTPTPQDIGITLHNMTPADDGFTHYFFCSTRRFLTEDREFTDFLRQQLLQAFINEDKPMLERQHERVALAQRIGASPILLACDAGAVRFRRKLKALITEEHI